MVICFQQRFSEREEYDDWVAMDARGVHLKMDAMKSGSVLAETRELVATSR